MDASKEEIEEVEGIGPVLAGIDPRDPRRSTRNRQLIEDLRAAGLNMEEAGGRPRTATGRSRARRSC